jgi:hypothetical protein
MRCYQNLVLNIYIMSNRDITLPDGSKLEWLSKTPNTFLNKSVILYGLSGMGKTSIIINILYILRNHISFPFIITKSQASAEHNYFKRVPRGCIKWALTKDWLEIFITKQSERSKIFDTVNKLENLKEVFNMIEHNTASILETQIIQDAECRIQTIELNNSLAFPKKVSLIKGIKKARDEALAILYKKFIRAYRVELENVKLDMKRESQLVVKYLDFMPHALLVFDDCAFMLKQWIKESTSIHNLFYQGRHIYTTIILGTQSDKEIATEIRKSAFISMFMSPQDVISAFSRASNSFPDHDRKKALMSSHAVFTPEGMISSDNFQKLVYIRKDLSKPFRYIIAEVLDDDDFKIGAECVWELDEKLYPRDKEKKMESIILEKYI